MACHRLEWPKARKTKVHPEEKAMYDPSKILTWLEEEVQMRQSRRKTLAAIVSGAMRLQGTGVLALGRAMEGPAKAKHRIKRVDRFLGTRGWRWTRSVRRCSTGQKGDRLRISSPFAPSGAHHRWYMEIRSLSPFYPRDLRSHEPLAARSNLESLDGVGDRGAVH